MFFSLKNILLFCSCVPLVASGIAESYVFKSSYVFFRRLSITCRRFLPSAR